MYKFYEQTPGHVIPPKRLTDTEYAAAIASGNLDPKKYMATVGFVRFNRPLIEQASGFDELARRVVLDLYDKIFKK